LENKVKWIKSNCCGEILKENIYISKSDANARPYELIKLLPEMIVEYFELTSYKKGEEIPIFT
jgi:hypothetical protein